MSSPTVVRGPVPASPQRRQPTRTSLRVVPPWAGRRTRGTFVVVVITGLAAGLVGLLLLNIAMQKGAFELARLDAQASELRTRQQALDLDVDRLASPARLAEQATAQGMVPTTNPVFLDIASGEVVGTPTPAAAATLTAEGSPVDDPPRRPGPPPQPDDGRTGRAER